VSGGSPRLSDATTRVTLPFLLTLYPWTKALHIVAIIAWMAATLYLPRLYVYHSETKPGSEMSERFKIMEHRLYKQILMPAMLATFLLGIILMLTPGLVDWHRGWFYVKLAAVLGLAGFHAALGRWRRDFLHDRNTRPQRFFRIANEVPTLLMVIAVVMVVVQPF
jgi:putative membrane protein